MEEWRWCNLAHRRGGAGDRIRPLLARWPVPLPADWEKRVNHYHTAGSGHLYQGRFKAFPIQQDEHLYTVLRYVERNALRAVQRGAEPCDRLQP